MTDTIKPLDSDGVANAIRWAIAEGKALDVIGHGTKQSLGRPAQSDLTLQLSGLTGVTLYEPEELVLSAKAGTPIAEIDELLASRHQELAFEPMDAGPLFGRPRGSGTLGGVLAANLSGPRRLKAGAARDHFLGATAVSGRGEMFKSGGRVVKNVTGYDLCKLLAGSWGTLAVMTDVTVKVLPRAETEETLLLLGLDDHTAARAMNAALGSSADVSGAAHLPSSVAARTAAGAPAASGAVTALRLEGVAPSIAQQRDILMTALKDFGELARLDEGPSRQLWRAIRDVVPFAAPSRPDSMLWRISTAPAQGPQLVAKVREKADAQVLYDWAGGLIWMECLEAADAATAVHASVAAFGGHAILIRAAAALRAAAPVFSPQQPVLAGLTKRIKAGFDPNGVLNPGRMYAGV